MPSPSVPRLDGAGSEGQCKYCLCASSDPNPFTTGNLSLQPFCPFRRERGRECTACSKYFELAEPLADKSQLAVDFAKDDKKRLKHIKAKETYVRIYNQKDGKVTRSDLGVG